MSRVQIPSPAPIPHSDRATKLITAQPCDDLGRPTSKTTTGSGGAARAAYTWTPNRAGQITAEASTISIDPTNGTRTYTRAPR